eukprot:Pgem_evm1s7160
MLSFLAISDNDSKLPAELLSFSLKNVNSNHTNIIIDSSQKINVNFTNSHGEKNEFSELLKLEETVYTFDDKTGIMYSIPWSKTNDQYNTKLERVHQFKTSDSKIAMKTEWATSLTNPHHILVGSHGVGYKKRDEVVVYDVKGKKEIAKQKWGVYKEIANFLDLNDDGYLNVEGVIFEPTQAKLFIFPRLTCNSTFGKGPEHYSNFFVSCDFNDQNLSCSNYQKTTLSDSDPFTGFSSVKLLNNNKFIALKTNETSDDDHYSTIKSFDNTGKVFWSHLLSNNTKFEGLIGIAPKPGPSSASSPPSSSSSSSPTPT